MDTQIFGVIVFVMAFIFFVILQMILGEYLSVKFAKHSIEVAITGELQNIDGIDTFVDNLLYELSEERVCELTKNDDKKNQRFAQKHWTFGKIESVCLQYSKEHNAFSISVTAKKLGSYTGYQMIYLEMMNFGEIEFRVHSFDKHLFQPSFSVTYMSDHYISVEELRKFANYKMAM